MSHPNIDLARLPEWSAFFGAFVSEGTLHVRWRMFGDLWHAQVVEFERDLAKPLTENPVGPPAVGSDRFEVLKQALSGCGRDFGKKVWATFHAFRAAATGEPEGIEDLL